MAIAVVLGTDSSNICDKLCKVNDSLELVPFSTLDELHKRSEYLQHSLERVVITSRVIKTEDNENIDSNISKIADVLESQDNFTNVVFLCKETDDKDLENKLVSSFSMSECAVLNILSTTIADLIKFASEDLQVLKDELGYVSEEMKLDNTCITDEVYLSEDDTSELSSEQSTNKQDTQSPNSFIKMILGRGKENEHKANKSLAKHNESEKSEIDSSLSTSEDTKVEPSICDSEDDKPSNTDELCTEDDYSITKGSDELSEENTNEPISIGSNKVSEENNKDNVDTDFKRVDIKGELSNTQSQSSIVEVDDSGDLLDLSVEDKYRQPKIKIVEKEVERIVEVGSGKSAHTRSNMITIVTGDRRSGVTSTALGIANELSKNKSNVLYVDFDSKRHGVLSHIDYVEFCKYDEFTLSATKLCENLKDIKNSSFTINSKLHLVTSDYNICDAESNYEHLVDALLSCLTEYNDIIVDVPCDSIKYVESLIPFAKVVVTCSGDVSGIFNMVQVLDSCGVQEKYLNVMQLKGTLLLTGVTKELNEKKILSQVSSVVEPDYNWLNMRTIKLLDFNLSSIWSILEV